MSTSIEYLRKCLDTPNIQAAIMAIRKCEGTDADDGYYYIFGSSPRNHIRFDDLSNHPNIMQVLNGYRSTAAGIGQIIYRTYCNLCTKYGFKDFGVETQQLMICAIFCDIGVLNDVCNGFMFRDDVMTKLSRQWASLPFANYGQPKKDIATVRGYYLDAGGAIGKGA